ncbi:hypothetical protein FEZ33_00480 [Ruoffia tabacinasalis]|uniref:Uncharacterized protein n=1 Tax=Ruoffia tabacinasalis TaxID=87458 RepID=A0A5R9EPE5_9LACT|nr:hypothetical protein [Ruoffia tabacinasalis]TLQ49497.1 hypothetical protein FEZ33_00480 [Ruoffia tabacinasalis]
MQGKYKYGIFITIVLVIVISAVFVFFDSQTFDSTITEQIVLESEIDDISNNIESSELTSEGDSIPPEEFYNEIETTNVYETQILEGQDLLTLFFSLNNELIVSPKDYELYTTPEVAEALAQAKRIEQQNNRELIKQVNNISYEIQTVSPLPLSIIYTLEGIRIENEKETNTTQLFLIKFDENNHKITTLEELNR